MGINIIVGVFIITPLLGFLSLKVGGVYLQYEELKKRRWVVV